MMSADASPSSCPHCKRVMVSINGDILHDVCPYCGRSLEREDKRNEQPADQEVSDLNRDALSLLHLTKTVKCWYCHTENDFSNQFCSHCGWDLSVVTDHREENEEEKLVNQMTEQQKEQCLIAGLLSFIKILAKRNGNDGGMIRCKQKGCNGGMYPYDAFTCPYCGKPSLLQELREVLHGRLHNKSILQLLQRFFPQFNIIKYTTSAMMKHEEISASKIDLESAASETASIIETASVFLKSVTGSPQKSTKRKNDAPTLEPINPIDFGGSSSTAPDNRILDLLSESAVSIDEEDQIDVTSEEDNDSNNETEDDWLNP